MVVVAVEFLVEDLAGLCDLGDVFADTGSHQVVLEPEVRAFDLASGLWGEGVDDLNGKLVHDLFPLRISLVGEKGVSAPEGVAALDKAEDGVGINIEGEGAAEAGD